MLQGVLDKVERATDDAFTSDSLQETLRLIVSIGNRLNLHSLLPDGVEPNPLQLSRFRKRAVGAIDLECLERVLGTRGHLEEGAKMSHFMVALCAPFPASASSIFRIHRSTRMRIPCG